MLHVEAVESDVTKFEVDAIANAVNTELTYGGGVGACGHRARSLRRVAFAAHGAAAASACRDAVES